MLKNNGAGQGSFQITTIDLLRHGECQDGQRYRGHSDVRLSQKGWQQMQVSIDALGGVQPNGIDCNWQQVITSPLLRCADFAGELASQNQLPISKYDDLRELYFGDWEGQLIEHVWQTQQKAVTAWGNDPVAYPPPGGEAADTFSERVTSVFLGLLQKHRGEHCLLISHGGVMRVLLTHCLSMPLSAMNQLDIPYACISRIQVFTEEKQHHFRLCGHNVTLKSSLDH